MQKSNNAILTSYASEALPKYTVLPPESKYNWSNSSNTSLLGWWIEAITVLPSLDRPRRVCVTKKAEALPHKSTHFTTQIKVIKWTLDKKKIKSEWDFVYGDVSGLTWPEPGDRLDGELIWQYLMIARQWLCGERCTYVTQRDWTNWLLFCFHVANNPLTKKKYYFVFYYHFSIILCWCGIINSPLIFFLIKIDLKVD
jgi:hypothetical protein